MPASAAPRAERQSVDTEVELEGVGRHPQNAGDVGTDAEERRDAQVQQAGVADDHVQARGPESRR